MSTGFRSTARLDMLIGAPIVKNRWTPIQGTNLDLLCVDREVLVFSFVEHCLRHAKDHAHHCPVCRQSLRSDAQIHAHCAYHMKKDEPGEAEEKKEDEDIDNFSFACPICGEVSDFYVFHFPKSQLSRKPRTASL